MVPGEQRSIQKALGLRLVGRYDGGFGFDSSFKGFAIGIQQRLHAAFSSQFDKFRIETWGHPRGNTAADHQPARALQLFPDDFLELRQFLLVNRCAGLVQRGCRDGDEGLWHSNPQRPNGRQQRERVGERRSVYRQNSARWWLHSVLGH